MKNILIVKHGALGDVIRTMNIVKPLFDKFDSPNIHWYTSKGSKSLIRFNPYIINLSSCIDDFKLIIFDLVISLDDELEIVKSICNLQYRKIIGAYLNGENILYTKDSSLWFDMGLISVYGKMKADELKRMNTKTHTEIFSTILGIEIRQPLFYNSSVIEERYMNFKSKDKFLVGINSGSGGRWKSKQLPIENVVSLIMKLQSILVDNKSVKIVLLGGESEKVRNNTIYSNCEQKENIEIANTAHSLLEFAAIINSLDYLFTSDSLALHLAISQGVKNLSFYAPTSAAEIDTFGLGVKVISTSSDYCNYSPDCDNSTITVDRLFNAFNSHVLNR